MKYVLLVLGVILVVGGGLSIYSGYNIIEIERGWASVLAGTTAATGGIITIGLALVVRSLDRIRVAIGSPGLQDATAGVKEARRSSEPFVAIHDLPIAPTASAAVSDAVAPEQAAAVALAIPGNAVAEAPRFEDQTAAVPAAVAEPAVAAPSRAAIETPKPAPKVRPLPRASTTFGETTMPHPAETSPSIDDIWRRVAVNLDAAKPSSTPETPPAASQPRSEEAAPEAPPPLAPTAFPEPTPEPQSDVIGRYEADGTAYVMFADGSIEAQSEQGLFRFKSMTELKAFFQT